MGRDTERGLAAGRVARQAMTRLGRHATRLRHGRLWACDTVSCVPRYNPVRTTTRRSTRCLGAVRVACASSLGSGGAPSAPNPVLDSVHCF